MATPIACPNCGAELSTERNGKVRLRVSLIAFTPDGGAECPCPRCKRDVRLPLTLKQEHRPDPPRPAAPAVPRGRLVFTMPRDND